MLYFPGADGDVSRPGPDDQPTRCVDVDGTAYDRWLAGQLRPHIATEGVASLAVGGRQPRIGITGSLEPFAVPRAEDVEQSVQQRLFALAGHQRVEQLTR